MKKILLALVLASGATVALAQDFAAEKKAIEKAEEATLNPKKNTKAAPWLKLGEAYVKAYDAAAGRVWLGASQQEMVILGAKAASIEEVQIGNSYFQKHVFPERNIYMDVQTGSVAAIEITKHAVPGALEKAVEAYKKAYEVEPAKASKAVEEAFRQISVKYNMEGMSYFTLKKMAESSAAFEKAAEVSFTAPSTAIDSNAVYNTAFAASFVPDWKKAAEYYNKCYEIGYFGENGGVVSSLAEAEMHIGDTLKAVNHLEEGFLKFPDSQSIMIGLINYYISSGSGTDKIFTLLDKAIENDPKNASLYYVKGNTYVEVKEYEKAAAEYDKAAEVDPSYVFSFIGKGVMYSKIAEEARVKASEEMDDAKYNAYVADYEKNIRLSIPPFEKAFETTKDASLRTTLAEMLRSAYYRFRDESPEAAAAYDKYNKIVKGEL